MKHPMQNLIKDGKTPKFVANKIIRYLKDTNKISLNELSSMYHLGMFELEDMLQFWQQLGYTLQGFYELSFVQEAVEQGLLPEIDELEKTIK